MITSRDRQTAAPATGHQSYGCGRPWLTKRTWANDCHCRPPRTQISRHGSIAASLRLALLWRWVIGNQDDERIVTGAAHLAATGRLEINAVRVAHGNTPRNRVEKIARYVATIRQAVKSHDGVMACYLLKDVLDELHALDDARRTRTEWSNAPWILADEDRWQALLGARNAAHHMSEHVAAIESGQDERIVWIDTIPPIRNENQRKLYHALLAGKLVLPDLDRALALLRAAIYQSRGEQS